MDIKRIDNYTDRRFSNKALIQHGAYLVDNEPYQVEIKDSSSAVVRGKDPNVYKPLIEELRFHAPHIFRFYNQNFELIIKYDVPKIFDVALENIQPSQFFIDEEKLKAVHSFIHKADDIVVQVIPYGERFISLDGHTRLYLAAQNGFDTVKAVESKTDYWVWFFVREAERKKITSPKDLILLPHDEYEIQWNKYCDKVFASNQKPLQA